MFTRGHHSAQRREGIVPAVDCAATRIRRNRCPECCVGDSEADFFPFHVAAGLKRSHVLIYPGSQQRVPPSLSPVGDAHPDKEQNRHRSPHRPAMTRRAGHSSQRVGQAGGNRKNTEQLNQVRQWGRILERVRAVRVKEAATIRAPFLDDLLRSHRPLCDGLLCHGVHHGLAIGADNGFPAGIHFRHVLRFDQLHRVVGLQVLNDSLRDQCQRSHDAKWQQHQRHERTRSTQKLPMVSISRRAMPRINAIATAIPTAADTKL